MSQLHGTLAACDLSCGEAYSRQNITQNHHFRSLLPGNQAYRCALKEGRAEEGHVFPISGFQEGGVFLKDEVETLPQLLQSIL